MKDETGGIVIKKFLGLKPEMYYFLVDNEHKKAKGINKNVVATKKEWPSGESRLVGYGVV